MATPDNLQVETFQPVFSPPEGAEPDAHKKATFILLHGRSFGAWVWKEVEEGLTAKGHDVYVPELPIKQKRLNYVQYAGRIAAEAEGAENIAVVAWSRPGRLVWWLADLLPVEYQIFQNADIPYSIDQISIAQKAPPKYPQAYQDTIHTRADGLEMWKYNPELMAYYLGLPVAQVENIWPLLRRQNPNDKAGLPPKHTDDRILSIYGTEDNIINNPYSIYSSREQLGVEAEPMECGHTPPLSHPGALVDRYDRFIQEAA